MTESIDHFPGVSNLTFFSQIKLTPKHFKLISIWMSDICFAIEIERFCSENKLKEWLIILLNGFFLLFGRCLWYTGLCETFLKKKYLHSYIKYLNKP